MKLNPRMEKAALLIAEGWKQAEIARQMRMAPQTITRWKRKSEFMARIEELRQDLTSQSVQILRDNVLKNTEIVLQIAEKGGEPGVVSSQLKAALWAVEKVLGRADTSASKQAKARRSVESEALRITEEEIQELLERGG